MIDLDELYFDWLLAQLDSSGVRDGVSYVANLLHNCNFLRRVGNDVNRAADGANLRKEFLKTLDELDVSEHVTNQFMDVECTWFEMLVALSRHLDFLYDGGVETRFLELLENMGLSPQLEFNPRRSQATIDYDQHIVDEIVHDIDTSQFDRNGRGGMFPLRRPDHPDQREVEIWDQHAAYFREKLEGVLWTSFN